MGKGKTVQRKAFRRHAEDGNKYSPSRTRPTDQRLPTRRAAAAASCRAIRPRFLIRIWRSFQAAGASISRKQDSSGIKFGPGGTKVDA